MVIMAGGQFNTLLHATSRSSFFLSRPFFNTTIIKNYGKASNGNRRRLMEERAPSTAEEFQRVAEEKAKEANAREGVPSQIHVHDKSCDDDDATKLQSVKNTYN